MVVVVAEGEARDSSEGEREKRRWRGEEGSFV